MTCAQDLDGEAAGQCRDAYIGFYLCVGEVSSCVEADLEAMCGESMTAIDAACG